MTRGAIALPADPPAHVACEVRCLDASGAPGWVDDGYVFDRAPQPGAEAATERGTGLVRSFGVVLVRGGADRAASLLEAGVCRVLLGDPALDDPMLVARLVARFGSGRVGVYVPARRLEVSWSFDTTSNADFKVLAPSVGAPAWEVLRAEGTRTGKQALWWIGEMFKAGAGEALLRVDIEDDADLNLCADCVERFGARVWIGPREASTPRLHEWARYGHATRFALPPALYAEARAAGAALERSKRLAERAA